MKIKALELKNFKRFADLVISDIPETSKGKIATSRQHYVELKECIKNDGEINSIIDSLMNDEFETFYPYFNMKNHFQKKYIEQFGLTVESLAKTQWFKQEMLKVLKL